VREAGPDSRPADPLGCERKSICAMDPPPTRRQHAGALGVTPPRDKIARGSL